MVGWSFATSTTTHTETPMTKTNMDLSEFLAKQDGGDFLGSVAEGVLQLIMEADVEGLIGAGRHERSNDRATWRNGYRERALDTRLGTLNLKVPKAQAGQLLPRLSGAAQNLGEGACRRPPGGVDRRCFHPPCRRTGAGHGAERHLEKHGVEALQKTLMSA